MRFKRVLTELQAEITQGGTIPKNRIFINNNVPKDIPPEWRKVLVQIINKLKSLNLINRFTKDASPVDIEGVKPSGNIVLRSDDGETFTYYVESDSLYDSNKKKLG